MREHFGATMNMRTLSPVLMTIMLLMAPCSLSNVEHESTMQAQDGGSFVSAGNTSGWLASAGGANQERIHGMIAFPNGSTLVGGMFIDLIRAERFLTPIGKKAADMPALFGCTKRATTVAEPTS